MAIDPQPRCPQLEDIVACRAVHDVSPGRRLAPIEAVRAEIDAVVDFFVRAVDAQVPRWREWRHAVRAGDRASAARGAGNAAGIRSEHEYASGQENLRNTHM